MTLDPHTSRPLSEESPPTWRRALGAALWAAALAGCVSTAPITASDAAPMQPEAASGFNDKSGSVTQRFAVAAANPLATQAGYQILKAGGSAVDAAVAVQMVLALVEPQSIEATDKTRVLCYPGDPAHTVSERALPGPTRLHYHARRFTPEDGFEALFR